MKAKKEIVNPSPQICRTPFVYRPVCQCGKTCDHRWELSMSPDANPSQLGNGVGLNFQWAMRSPFTTRRQHAESTRCAPQVGYSSWEVVFADPDGYKVHFASPIEVPEE